MFAASGSGTARTAGAGYGVVYLMFALWKMIGFRRMIALWLLRRAWRMYLSRRARTRSAY